MSTCTITPAKDQLSRLVDAVRSGEAVTFVRSGKPVADITPRAASPQPMTRADVDEMARKCARRPRLGQESVSLVREMRDERQ